MGRDRRVSIKWPEALIDDSLVEYLASIPVEEVEAMRRRGAALRCLFAYQVGRCRLTLWNPN